MTTWDDIQTAIQNFWNWLTSTAGSVSVQFTDTLGELGSWLFGGLKWLADQIYSAWTHFSDWLYSGLQWLGDRLKEGYEALAQWISGGLQWIGSGLSWIGQQLYSFGQWLWNGIIWVARTVANAIEGFINWVWEGIVNIYNDIVNYLASWVHGINDFLNDWIKSLRDKFKDLVLVNTTLPAIFKSLDKITEGDILKGLLGMFVSPFAGAVAGELVDVVVPRPHSERIMFFPEFLLPTLTYSPITIEKPTTPTTPTPTEIPTTPMYPPAIGYRPTVEKVNSVSSRYEIYVQGMKTTEKYNSVSSMYEITLQEVTEISKSSSVKTKYEIVSTTPIEVSKGCSVKTQYDVFLSEVETISKSNSVKSQYDIRATTPTIVSKGNLAKTQYSTKVKTPTTVSKGNSVKTQYTTEVKTPVNRVINGGFETGDLTGWSVETYGYNTHEASVESGCAHSGNYGCRLKAATPPLAGNGSPNYVRIKQNVDLTDVDKLEFWYKIVNSGGPIYRFAVYIDDAVKFSSSGECDWTYGSVDVSEYTGEHTIMFEARAVPNPMEGAVMEVCIDDIKAIAWE